MASTRHEEAELNITLGEEGARALIRHYPGVKTLYLRYQPDENHARNYSVTTASILSLFSVLGDHPSLLTLVLDDVADMEADDHCHCHFPIQALTIFLRKAQKLKSLQLDLDTPLAGSTEEGNQFLQAIRDHETLESLEIGDFGNESSQLGNEFSPISVPRWVNLSVSYTGNRISNQQVEGTIVRSTCLRNLLIDTSNGSFPDQYLARIFDGLKENISHFTELNLLDDLNDQRTSGCADVIRLNTTLKHLFVSLGNEPRYGVTITRALQENLHIESLRIVLSSQSTEEARRMVHNLRSNQSLRRIHFHFQGRSGERGCYECYLKPFEDIMEDNHTLEEIRMDKCHGAYPLTPKIEFCLSLNRAGRKDLLQTTDQARYRSLWVGKVIQYREDVNIVYYFLSRNPSFLQSQGTEEEEKTLSRKRKAADLEQRNFIEPISTSL